MAYFDILTFSRITISSVYVSRKSLIGITELQPEEIS